MTVALPYCYVNRDFKEATDTKLLLLSIFVKWNPIAMGCCEDKGSDNCPLCKYYGVNCILCPIFKKTNEIYCVTTPYTKFVNTSPKNPAIYDAIEEEIEFLISLLDKETQKNLENIFIEWCKDGGK
jgi:hypothetical protein